MDQNLVFCLINTDLAGMPLSIEKELYHDLPPPTISLDFLPSPSIEQNDSNKKSLPGNRLSDYQKGILMDWITNNFNHPYPTNTQKIELMRLTGLDRHRLNVWFTNHRIRGNFTFRQRRVDPLIITKELISAQIQATNFSQKQHKNYAKNQNKIPSPSNFPITPPIIHPQSSVQNGPNQQVQFSFPIVSSGFSQNLK